MVKINYKKKRMQKSDNRYEHNFFQNISLTTKIMSSVNSKHSDETDSLRKKILII